VLFVIYVGYFDTQLIAAGSLIEIEDVNLGRWKTEDRRRKLEDLRRKTEDGSWKTEDGRQKLEDRRRRMDFFKVSIHRSFLKSKKNKNENTPYRIKRATGERNA
jgi:hypothetical protein